MLRSAFLLLAVLSPAALAKRSSSGGGYDLLKYSTKRAVGGGDDQKLDPPLSKRSKEEAEFQMSILTDFAFDMLQPGVLGNHFANEVGYSN
jgi:hypothetical protein